MQELAVKSLTGQHYTAQAIIDRNRRINGERDITLSFLFNEINSEFIKDIETGWKLKFQGDWYHLFNEKTDVNGNKSFSGVLDFYHYMNGFWHMDEVENKSMTVQDAMMPLFKDKEYVLQIIDSFTANTMSYSKQQNSTERFSYFVDRFNAEYNIPIGTKTVQLRNKIGVTRNDVIIHEDDNLEDLSIDIDSSSFCTAINGYYDFQKPKDTKDGEELVPTKEFPYISPMAEKYGVIWGEPIHDERFSKLDAIKAACKEKQENSYKISYTIKKSLLGNALNEGDYVRFVAPSYNINTYVRVVEIKEQFDDDLDLIDEEYTFGNENIATAFSKMQYEAIRDVSDIMKGKKPIPYSVLPKAVREATNVINAGSTTQFYYREDGIYGYNTSNPLGVTRYNANGIGFSQDGGQTFQTAMTYLGIVANAITAGTINTNNVSVYGAKDGESTQIAGGKILSTGSFVRTFPQGLAEYESYTESWNGTYRSGLISKKSGGKTQTGITRWLSLNDKSVTTQREIHSASPDKNGARFIDFFAEETYGSDVTGQGMHIYSGQALNIESEYGLYLNSRQRFYIRTEDSGLEINKNGQNLVLKRTSPFGSEVGSGGSYMSIQSSDGVEQGNVGILSDNRNLSVKSSFGDVHLRGKMTKVFDSDSENYTDITAKDFIKASSRELKTNIEPLVDGIEKIKSLTPVAYDYKHDLENGIESGDIGFIAEDSDCIAVADGKAISVQKVATWAVLATKEQQDIIEQHEEKIKLQDEKIKQQQETINKLIERMDALESK